MIRRVGADAARIAAAAVRQPQPGLLAMLWLVAYAGVRGDRLSAYDWSGSLLVTHGGTGVLLPEGGLWAPLRRRLAHAEELAAFAAVTGLQVLYADEDAPGTRCGARQLLDWMTAPEHREGTPPGDLSEDAGEGATEEKAAPDTQEKTPCVRLLQRYAPAAELVCDGLPEAVKNDFYADLCLRRNRGLMQVPGLGPEESPDGCLAVSGPVLLGGRQYSYLSDLTVRPSCRGQGCGTALMRYALHCAAGTPVLYCDPALTGYYAGMGFRRGGRVARITFPDTETE